MFGLAPTREQNVLSLEAIGAIVNEMVAVRELASLPNLQAMINMLPEDIRGTVPYQGVPRNDILQLLLTCQSYENGRDALALVLDVGMRNRHDLGLVMEALNRYWPTPNSRIERRN